jgi:hypothetical protein
MPGARRRAIAFHAATGVRPRISPLDYNAIGDRGAEVDRFAVAADGVAFRAVLSAAGLPSHRRYSSEVRRRRGVRPARRDRATR